MGFSLLSLVLTPQSGLSFTPSTYTLARRCITIHTRISPRRKNHNKFATKPSSGAVISTGSTKDDIISSSGIRISSRIHEVGEIPPCPKSLESRLEDSVDSLYQWFQGKSNILCLTGAGISTDSGIPDYRGHNGSYHKGHKPMIHDEFMKSHRMRQRYWGRAMVGWRDFVQATPNEGHIALAKLESMGKIGVTFEDSMEYYKPNCEESGLNWAFSAGYRKMTIITQNVDGLHIKAGGRRNHVTELHGRNDRLVCMNCGAYRCRHDFHNELDLLNANWLQEQQQQVLAVSNYTNKGLPNNKLRPDGDAFLPQQDFQTIQVPPCTDCSNNSNHDAQSQHPGFFKPDVVFFGDSVPKHRVNRCYAAVDASDGLLCIGSSLAVHSAYRFVQRAATKGIPIAILNVGETRAELSGLDVLKVEAPAGPSLEALVAKFEQD